MSQEEEQKQIASLGDVLAAVQELTGVVDRLAGKIGKAQRQKIEEKAEVEDQHMDVLHIQLWSWPSWTGGIDSLEIASNATTLARNGGLRSGVGGWGVWFVGKHSEFDLDEAMARENWDDELRDADWAKAIADLCAEDFERLGLEYKEGKLAATKACEGVMLILSQGTYWHEITGQLAGEIVVRNNRKVRESHVMSGMVNPPLPFGERDDLRETDWEMENRSPI